MEAANQRRDPQLRTITTLDDRARSPAVRSFARRAAGSSHSRKPACAAMTAACDHSNTLEMT